MRKDTLTIYLAGAGGKGNIGAEAIVLATVTLLQDRFPKANFIISSWQPDRIRRLFSASGVEIVTFKRESLIPDPACLKKSDFFIVCGDVALSENVIAYLPLYWSLRALTAKLFGCKVIFFGIEAEKLRLPLNRLAVRHLLGRAADGFIVRNNASYDNLNEFWPGRSNILAGCEPSLTLNKKQISSFKYKGGNSPPGSRLIVGFGVRDFFAKPLRFNPLKRKLKRSDVPAGHISPDMERIIDFTARLARYLVQKHGAYLVFIPHHFLPEEESVILPDAAVAEMIINKAGLSDDSSILENNLHPYTVLDIYQRLDLAVSMRHHTNSFALLFGVPTVGFSISQKILNFFDQTGGRDRLVNPLTDDFKAVTDLIDHVVHCRAAISRDLTIRLSTLQDKMRQAVRMVFT